MPYKVAFQGIHGAYSEQAIRQHFGEDVQAIPQADFSALFEVLQTRQVDFALLPIENALAGAVSGAYELLMDYDVRIQAEVIYHVHHNLLAPRGCTLADIQFVRSHPQALAQCERFLKRHSLKPVVWYDTAGAAHDLARDRQTQTAAIASRLAAELYDLDVIAPEIEDVPFNFTRFFLLGHDDPQPSDYNKTSLVFAVRHRPSALYDCLGEFASRGINLTKIESRPRRNRPWEPIFFLDFEGYWRDAPCQEALMQLLQKASFVKMLGSYPAVKTHPIGI